jgi:hypothetical protein
MTHRSRRVDTPQDGGALLSSPTAEGRPLSVERPANVKKRAFHPVGVDEAGAQQVAGQRLSQMQLPGALHQIVGEPRVADEQRQDEDQVVRVHGAGHGARVHGAGHGARGLELPFSGQDLQVTRDQDPLRFDFDRGPTG